MEHDDMYRTPSQLQQPSLAFTFPVHTISKTGTNSPALRCGTGSTVLRTFDPRPTRLTCR